MPKKTFKVMLTGFMLVTHFLEAATRVVNSTSNDPNTIGTLPYWLLNADSGDTIDCSAIAGQSITLTSSLPAIANSCTINGAGITINGADTYQAFQVASGNVVINNVNIQNAVSKGGDGGDGYSGGGGAVGGGGAIYVHGGTSVTLSASSLTDNIARGGDGGDANINGNAGGGGGGGFGGGNGGDCLTLVSTGGGGGGHSNGGNGGSNVSINGGDGVYFGGGGGGAGINSVAPGGSGGDASNAVFTGGAQSGGNGGGGAGSSEDGFSATGSGSNGAPGNGGNGIGSDSLYGAGGGGGGALESVFPGASGAGAGGGGGGPNLSGGAGGTLGGGGGGGIVDVGGEGGFGAGGGGASVGGTGGAAGGGNGGSDSTGNAAGGGGSGLGGAIFIQSGASLTIVDATEISGNTAIAGIGGSSTSGDPNYVAPGDGAALGADIFMREEGSITFNLSNTLTIATPIEGDQTNGPNTSGGLQKIGAGTLRLNGANTYSGTTTVDEGTLNLNGSVIGNAVVGANGTLSGNATVSGNLTNSGILAPGNSIGTINTTNLTLNPSSKLEIEIAANGTNDLIAATGTAQIDGTLEVIPLRGDFVAPESYTIITAAGGRSGTFSRVESLSPMLVEVIYNANSIVIDALPVSALDLDSNAEAAASCFLADGFTTGSDVEAINAALLTLDADGIAKSFNQMQPSQYSGLAWSQIENALLVRSGYLQHLEDLNLSCSCCNNPRIWGEAIGAWQKQNSTGQQFGFSDWTAGATIGLDAVSCNTFRLGVAGSYSHSHLNWEKAAGHANVNSGYGGIYTNWTNGCGYVNAALLGAYSHYKTERHLHFANINRRAKSSHNGWESLAGIEAGFKYDFKECLEIIPFLRVDYVYLSRQGFQERGAGSLNLEVNRKQNQIIQSELGFIWIGNCICENICSGKFIPRVKMSYINDAQLDNRHLKASFVDTGCGFSVRGLSFRRNLGAVSLGLAYRNCDDTIGVTLRYDGQFGCNYTNQSANIALDICF